MVDQRDQIEVITWEHFEVKRTGGGVLPVGDLGHQRFGVLVAGDALVCVNSVDEITSRGGHDFMTTRTEVTTEAGEPVVTVWSKLVQRGEENHG